MKAKTKTAFIIAFFQIQSLCMAEVIELKPINLGSIAVISNSKASKVSVYDNGKSVVEGEILIITPPSPGEFIITDLEPNKNIYISTAIIQSESRSNSLEQFSLTKIYTPNIINTDTQGNATIPVGARIETSGTGNNSYSNTTYNFSYKIYINY